jgi:hypothetical protein
LCAENVNYSLAAKDVIDALRSLECLVDLHVGGSKEVK